jgi:hypothetical protein
MLSMVLRQQRPDPEIPIRVDQRVALQSAGGRAGQTKRSSKGSNLGRSECRLRMGAPAGAGFQSFFYETISTR